MINEYTDSFKLQYEKFRLGCDTLEDLGVWKKDEMGDMEVYFSNDLLSIILRMIATDGIYSEAEAAYVNEAFGFEYTAETLQEVYEQCADEISSVFQNGSLGSAYRYLETLNRELADAYKELLLLLLDIIIASDGVIADSEVALAHNIKEIYK